MARRVAWTGIALLAIYLVFIGGGWQGIYRSDLRTITVLVAAGALAVWAWAAWRDPTWHPRSRLAPALVACLASLAISTALSREPRMSLEYLGYAVLLVALYLLLVRLLAEPSFRNRLMGLGALLFGVLAIEFIGGVVVLWVQWWTLNGALVLPPLRPYFIGLSYGNPSAVLAMVSLLGVPAAFLAATGLRRWRLPVLAVIVAALGLVALLSGSRTGWLGLAVAVVAVGLTWLLGPDGRAIVGRAIEHLRTGAIPRAWRFAGGATIVVAVVAVIVLAPAVVRRVEAGGEDVRTIFFVTALRLFGQSPIVGTGPGSWAIEHTAVTQAGEIEYYVPHAHDVPAQTLAELGLVGALVGVVLLASVGWLVWTAIRSHDPRRRWLGYLTATALVYFAIQNVLDFYANFPAVLFAVALPIAYLDATAPEAPSLAARAPARVGAWVRSRQVATVARWAMAFTCAIAVAGLLLHESPASAGERAVAAADQGDWLTAFDQASLAAAQDPDIHPYAMTAGLAAAHLDEPQLAAGYLRTVAEGDDLPEAWIDLAAIEAQLGDHSAALDAVHAALRLGVQRTPIVMAAGGLLLQLGKPDEARQAFATAVAQRPSLAGDPWWQTPDVAAVVPSIADLAIRAAAPGSRWKIALMAGDQAGAATYALDSTAPAIARQVVAAWANADSASKLLATCNADPSDLERLSWCARLADHIGQTALADQFRTLAEGIQLGTSEGAAELRVAGPNDPRVATSQTAQFWGTYGYRRPTPQDLLVPSLIHLVLE